MVFSRAARLALGVPRTYASIVDGPWGASHPRQILYLVSRLACTVNLPCGTALEVAAVGAHGEISGVRSPRVDRLRSHTLAAWRCGILSRRARRTLMT